MPEHPGASPAPATPKELADPPTATASPSTPRAQKLAAFRSNVGGTAPGTGGRPTPAPEPPVQEPLPWEAGAQAALVAEAHAALAETGALADTAPREATAAKGKAKERERKRTGKKIKQRT